MHVLALFTWIVLGIPTIALVTFLGGRLLGARRGWLALVIAGFFGWLSGVVIAGEITAWRWSSLDMVLVTIVLGTLFTMIIALGIDMLAPVGTLKRGAEAGLVQFSNPIASMARRRAIVRRYREVVHLARVNGVVTRHVDHDALPDGVRRTLEQAGGIFVKMGQVASTRSDVLPEAWCQELSKLRASAEPAPEAAIRPLIEAEIGGSVDEVYTSFDWTPIASASIAQVYAATLQDGREVVVKVQRPGLDDRMDVDRGAVLQLAGLIERHTALGLSVRPIDLATEFLNNVAEELDFSIEASNATALREGLAGFEGVRIPDIDALATTKRVLTEERVSGVSIADGAALTAYGLDQRALADRLLRAFLTQIFDVGVFHADPHPGNILVEPDGTIVLIDLGAVGRLGPNQRAATLNLLVAAASMDSAAIRQALVEIVDVDERADLRSLDRVIDRMLAKHVRPGGGISAEAFADLAVVTGQYGMRFPDWLATLTRTMVTLEGTLTTIDPEFSLVDGAREHAGDIIAGGGGGFRAAFEHEALRQMPKLRRLPDRLDAILGQAAENKLGFRLHLFSDPRNEQVITRIFNRLVLAIVAASVGLGSIMLLSVKAGPHLGTSVSINEVLGYVGLVTASVLIMRLVAGIIRDGTT